MDLEAKAEEVASWHRVLEYLLLLFVVIGTVVWGYGDIIYSYFERR